MQQTLEGRAHISNPRLIEEDGVEILESVADHQEKCRTLSQKEVSTGSRVFDPVAQGFRPRTLRERSVGSTILSEGIRR